MFGNGKNTEEPKKTSPATPSSALNVLVKGTALEGTLRCESDLRVDGSIKGKLNCQAKVIIGPTGSVDGEIHCQNAVIEGVFKGKLTVTELLNVRETAEVDGEINTNKLIVQSGAKFNVSCRMEIGATNGASKNFEGKPAQDVATKVVAGGKAQVGN